MLTVFFNQEGVVHHEYVLQGRIKNKEYKEDLEFLKRLYDAVKRKYPHLKKWELLYYDMIMHPLISPDSEIFLLNTALSNFVKSYSPDITPCNF